MVVSLRKPPIMEKLRIYDFDGVLFQHPSHCILEMAQEIPEELMDRIGEEGYFFTEEMINEPLIRPYYEAFVRRYFSKTMSPENVLRLESAARSATLAIASLNNRETVERHLRGSGIRHLFGPILTQDDTRNKGEMFRQLCKGYDPTRDVSFVTDTVSDIEIARAFCPQMKIEAVVSGIDTWRSLVGLVGEDKIIAPYY